LKPQLGLNDVQHVEQLDLNAQRQLMAQVGQLRLLFTIERLPLRLERRGDFPLRHGARLPIGQFRAQIAEVVRNALDFTLQILLKFGEMGMRFDGDSARRNGRCGASG